MQYTHNIPSPAAGREKPATQKRKERMKANGTHTATIAGREIVAVVSEGGKSTLLATEGGMRSETCNTLGEFMELIGSVLDVAKKGDKIL